MSPLSNLLLVDADAAGLQMLTHGFELEGCRVTGLSDAGRALDVAHDAAVELAVVALREPASGAFSLIKQLRGTNGHGLPVVTLGPADLRTAALAAGASDFLPIPLFVRDVVSIGKLAAHARAAQAARAPEDDSALEVPSALSEYHGLFYLLRAMATSGRSGMLQLNRRGKKAQLRFSDGAVMTGEVAGLQGLPAVHHLLLWDEAELSFRIGPVAQLSQLHLSPEELIDECERFLRDLAFSARDLGPPRTVYLPAAAFDARAAGMQPSHVGPVLRLFDGQRTLADVIEESPYRVFDTLRVMKRLRDAGALTARADAHGADAPRSFLEQWAQLPDLRGVVGDRRRSRRRLKPVPAKGAAATPIPLTMKKPDGDAPPRRTHKTPSPIVLVPPVVLAPPPPSVIVAPDIGIEPTVQAKLDASGLPVAVPLIAAQPAPVTAQETKTAPKTAPTAEPRTERKAVRRARTPTPLPLLPAEAKAILNEIAPPRLTPSTAFDAVEADFFAREADLYKREHVENFDDLDTKAPPKRR